MGAAPKARHQSGVRSEIQGVSASVKYPEKNFVLQLEPKDDPTQATAKLLTNRQFIMKQLEQYGAVLFHNFQLEADDFRKIANYLTPQFKSMNYVGGVSSRSKHEKTDLYLSTTFPKEGRMPQHHEMSYRANAPRYVFFFCETPSVTGGETPICSGRRFTALLNKKIFNEFAERRVLYVRNYLDNVLGPGWKQGFETNDKAKAEEICRSQGVDLEWRTNGVLRTRNVAQGVVKHPSTGEVLWHNHSYVLNLGAAQKGARTPSLRMNGPGLSKEALEMILSSDPMDLPFNTFWGNDGQPFSVDLLEEIHALYERESVAFTWQKGDFVLLDNYLTSHGRNSFEGDERTILTILK